MSENVMGRKTWIIACYATKENLVHEIASYATKGESPIIHENTLRGVQ